MNGKKRRDRSYSNKNSDRSFSNVKTIGETSMKTPERKYTRGTLKILYERNTRRLSLIHFQKDLTVFFKFRYIFFHYVAVPEYIIFSLGLFWFKSISRSLFF